MSSCSHVSGKVTPFSDEAIAADDPSAAISHRSASLTYVGDGRVQRGLQRRMANFTVRTVNSTIATEHQHVSQGTAAQALSIGVRGAVQIASDEIDRGATAAFVEVIVEDEAGDHKRARRYSACRHSDFSQCKVLWLGCG